MIKIVIDAKVWNEPPLIYLDNWALSDFSTEASWRKQFLNLFEDRGTLAVSLMNVVEIASPGKKRSDLRSFLEEIGPHWFPLTVSPFKVMQAQETGHHPESGCFSEAFLKDPRFLSKLCSGNRSLAHLIDLTEGPAGVALQAADRSSEICKDLSEARIAYSANPKGLDTRWPSLPFSRKPQCDPYITRLFGCARKTPSFSPLTTYATCNTRSRRWPV
jgi:hypothetical protein